MIKTYQSPHLPPAISWGWRVGLHSTIGQVGLQTPPPIFFLRLPSTTITEPHTTSSQFVSF